MTALAINYRNLSYETLMTIINLANQLGVPPKEVSRRYLLSDMNKKKQQADGAA